MKAASSVSVLAMVVLLTSNAFGEEENKSPASADLSELSLEQLMTIEIPTVVGASKHEQKVSDAPSTVTIVTKDDIKKFGYRKLADILSSVRGLYNSFDGAYYYGGVRGVDRPGDYGGRILVTINGHRINEPIYDSSFLGYDLLLDVDLIERVEVIRGSGSSLYGNNAFFAVFNIVTQKDMSVAGNGGEVSGSFGTSDIKKGRVIHNFQLENGLEGMISGSYLDSDGARELFFPGQVDPNLDHDGRRALDIYASLSYAGLTLEGAYGKSDRDFPGAPSGAIFGDLRNNVVDERAYAELRYEHDFGEAWNLMARTYFDYYHFDGTSAFDYGPPSPPRTIFKEVPVSIDWGIEAQFCYTIPEWNRLTFGSEFRHDPVRYLLTYDEPQTFGGARNIYSPDTNFPTHTVGVYLQDEFSILRNLVLNAGVRYDYFSTFGSTVNPRIALIYHPWEPTTIKAIYGQAYRAPNFYELNYVTNQNMAAVGLRPETIRSYELAWEQTLAKQYLLTAAFFYNDVNALITQVGDGTPGNLFTFQNTDSVRVFGGEIELEANWGKGFRGRASYTFADARNGLTGEILDNSPQHLGKFQLTIPVFREKIFVSFELQAMSERITNQNAVVGGFAIGNLTLFSKELVKNLEVSASIYNLWNQQYSDPSPAFAIDTIPRGGLSAEGKATYRF